MVSTQTSESQLKTHKNHFSDRKTEQKTIKAGNDVNTNAFYLPKLNSEKTVNNSTPQSASRAASHRTSTFSGAKLQNVLLCLYYNLCNFADVDSFHVLICGFLQFLVNCSIFSKYKKKRKESFCSILSYCDTVASIVMLVYLHTSYSSYQDGLHGVCDHRETLSSCWAHHSRAGTTEREF